MKWYAHFADELPALEYRDNAFEAWAEIDARREFEPQFKDSTIFVKKVEPAKLSDFLPSSSQLVSLMRENMVEKLGNDDGIDIAMEDGGQGGFPEALSAACGVFGEAIDQLAAECKVRIDGDVIVEENHYRPGEHP